MISQDIQKILRDAIEKEFPEAKLDEIVVSVPKHKNMGDLATPVAMQLAKMLKHAPMGIAQRIAERLQDEQMISKVESVAPGFLNLTLSDKYLCRALEMHSPQEQKSYGGGEKILLEYAALNVAKHAHVGHIRNIAIGESLNRIFRHMGYEVTTVNHVGDWGTQFGKVIYAFEHWGNRQEVEKDPIDALNSLYVEFHKRAHEDPSLEAEARSISLALEKGDEKYMKIWRWIVDINVVAMDEMLQGIGVNFDEHKGESFYLDKMDASLDKMEKKGLLTHNEDGSVAVNFEEHGINLPSCLVKRRDGATLYLTRDIATVEYRVKEYGAKRIIYVVGDEQSLHFKQLFAICHLLELDKDAELCHVNYGLITLPEGKMSTRKGTVVRAEDVFNESVVRAKKILEDRYGTSDENMAKDLGYGALFYSMLSIQAQSVLTFRWDDVLSFEGNSAPYLQYVHARACSLLDKAKYTWDDNGTTGELFAQERELYIHLVRFDEVLENVLAEYKPNHLCLYLYELASLFNTLYNSVRILDAKEGDKRRLLLLTQRVQETMQKGLWLLNIAAPRRM